MGWPSFRFWRPEQGVLVARAVGDNRAFEQMVFSKLFGD
jgi:hypothetical protein